MADVFISYSKADRALTESLATSLQASGLSVWWDTGLVSGDSFRNVIISELAKARAVIVIWTERSVKSDWVLSEVTRAHARRVLVPVAEPSFSSELIPPPFDVLHTDVVTNTAGILAALAKLGVVSTVSATSGPTALPLPDKPSIAVLPFANLSGDPEQEYFADGMVEEIITALSRMRQLFVIARNSTFAYKGQPVNVKQVGRDLGVRYVLEGSVRKSKERLRIAGQLIDAELGVHLWAERFDGQAEDVFDVQDQVTAAVIGAITPRLEQAEISRVKRLRPESLEAYDCYLRGIAEVHHWTRESIDDALGWFTKAIELDPGFAAAYAGAGICYFQRKTNGWMLDRDFESAEAVRLARLAAERGRDDPVALGASAIVIAHIEQDLDAASKLIDRALALNPNSAASWHYSGWITLWLGNPDEALEHLGRAMRLSPLDPQTYSMQAATAAAHLCAGRFEAAAEWAKKALLHQPKFGAAARICTASEALAGRLDEARKTAFSLTALDPGFRVSDLGRMIPFRRAEHLALMQEGLRRAGVPE